ncbi:hypothetical protein G3I74_04670 [Wenzhouxiangella sp. C33]|uniref:CopG family transcriptional regulator n=1 Tax=Wenzhouxiangella limi TaxID=2707351 RepID=A0A845UWM6_9GAMM|nr:hypothetical protein [Wenzhouxiangella limi]
MSGGWRADRHRKDGESDNALRFSDDRRARRSNHACPGFSLRTISLRLPETLLERIRIEANKRDMPYQSLIKAWLAEDVERHQR